MTNDELTELSSRARADGRRLFQIVETLHRIGMIVLALLLLGGGVIVITLLIKEDVLIALAIAGVIGFICWLMYLAVVLSTYLSKVLIHSMFCMPSTFERLSAETYVGK